MTVALEPIKWTPEQVLAAARGAFKVYQFGQPQPSRLSKDQWRRFRDACREGFARTLGRGDTALRNIWFTWCEVNWEPYILVKERGATARLELDLIAHGTHLSIAESNRIADLIEPLYPPSRRGRIKMRDGEMRDWYSGSDIRVPDDLAQGRLFTISLPVATSALLPLMSEIVTLARAAEARRREEMNQGPTTTVDATSN